MWDQFDDLFLSGVFAPREALLRGLTLEQVGKVPAGAPHSIYQELWHANSVVRKSLDGGRIVLESWPLVEHFPPGPEPASQSEWDDLVTSYLTATTEAVERARQPGWLNTPDPGYEEHDMTWRDALEFLAVHSAYHLGRIVLLRQLLGLWPPPREVGGRP
jgi:uncharacterized damage-inducible protein DinB